MKFDVLIIGAGAAGCFAAIQAKAKYPDASICILEKSNKALAKVKVSGGGRCNVTNVISSPSELSQNYPRGARFLKKAFHTFSSDHMKRWLEERGVPLRLYPDGCYFPQSNSSQTIIDLFLKELSNGNISIHFHQGVAKMEKINEAFVVTTQDTTWEAKNVICTTGGHPKRSGFSYLEGMGVEIIEPVPSLFTFNLPDNPIVELMGIVKENAIARLKSEKWTGDGPLLITHWGLSGPTILKCSAFGARILHDSGYNYEFSVNWTGGMKQNEVLEILNEQLSSGKQIGNTPLFDIKSRLWVYLLEKAGIKADAPWKSLNPKNLNKLTEVLTNSFFHMQGKTTFKEEFVTAGGVDLNFVDVNSMEHKQIPGLFFAGEVLDIDGITGGFNFQSAWTTAFIAGNSVRINDEV